jgi:hypothetical protein
MDLNTLKEYIKLHILSLEQDLESLRDKTTDYISDEDHDDIICIEAQQVVLHHILGVMNER